MSAERRVYDSNLGRPSGPGYFSMLPNFDAVLVHSYWLSRSEGMDSINGFRGSLRTRLATRAAFHMYNSGQCERIVFLGGHLKGPSYPSTAELSAKEAIEKYGIPPQKVVAQPLGYGTEEEAVEFRRLATENSWRSLGVLGFVEHFPSISRFIPGTNPLGETTVEHVTVQNTLLENEENPHVLHLLKRLDRSRYHFGFLAYELAKTAVMSLPGGKDRLYAKNKSARSTRDDSKFNDVATHAIDVFRS